MRRIALIGPGAIGTTLAGWLAHAGHDVTVAARTPVVRLRIEAPGGVIEAAPLVLTDPAQASPVDWVIVTTKTYDAAGCGPWLTRFAGPEPRVAVVQNGVEHRLRFAGHVADERLVPVIAYLPAERRAPGDVLQRGNGRLLAAGEADGRAFAALFAATAISVETTADWLSAAWRKLALNAAGAVHAITLRPGEIAHRAAMGQAILDIAHEAMIVGRAEGADLPDDLPVAILEHMRDEAPDGMNSIQADRAAGRPMEVDARNGVIVRLGAGHRIATPANRLVVALLDALGEAR